MLVVGDAASTATARRRRAPVRRPAIDPRLRGIVLTDRLAGSPLAPVADRDDVLAVARRRRRVDALPAAPRAVDSGALRRCPSSRPTRCSSALLWQHTVVAVALVQFLRALSAPDGWRSPPVRAAFLFDDPNLRWRSYGFIDYRRAGRARRRPRLPRRDGDDPAGRRAAAPADGRRSSRSGATGSRSSSTATTTSRGAAQAARARRRARAWRPRRCAASSASSGAPGLRVDRVMTPPHGLCSENVTPGARRRGLRRAVRDPPDPVDRAAAAVGAARRLGPADFVAGCAVIPRRTLDCSAAEIALHAFLDHPIVLYGHHEDLAHGLEPLAEAAARVNRLGDVRWMSLGDIAAGQPRAARERRPRRRAPYARRVRRHPAGRARARSRCRSRATRYGDRRAQRLVAGDPGPSGPSGPKRRSSATGRSRSACAARATSTRGSVAPPAWRPWPKLRRAATETRDRALPLRPARAR